MPTFLSTWLAEYQAGLTSHSAGLSASISSKELELASLRQQLRQIQQALADSLQQRIANRQAQLESLNASIAECQQAIVAKGQELNSNILKLEELKEQEPVIRRRIEFLIKAIPTAGKAAATLNQELQTLSSQISLLTDLPESNKAIKLVLTSIAQQEAELTRQKQVITDAEPPTLSDTELTPSRAIQQTLESLATEISRLRSLVAALTFLPTATDHELATARLSSDLAILNPDNETILNKQTAPEDKMLQLILLAVDTLNLIDQDLQGADLDEVNRLGAYRRRQELLNYINTCYQHYETTYPEHVSHPLRYAARRIVGHDCNLDARLETAIIAIDELIPTAKKTEWTGALAALLADNLTPDGSTQQKLFGLMIGKAAELGVAYSALEAELTFLLSQTLATEPLAKTPVQAVHALVTSKAMRSTLIASLSPTQSAAEPARLSESQRQICAWLFDMQTAKIPATFGHSDKHWLLKDMLARQTPAYQQSWFSTLSLLLTNNAPELMLQVFLHILALVKQDKITNPDARYQARDLIIGVLKSISSNAMLNEYFDAIHACLQEDASFVIAPTGTTSKSFSYQHRVATVSASGSSSYKAICETYSQQYARNASIESRASSGSRARTASILADLNTSTISTASSAHRLNSSTDSGLSSFTVGAP